MSPLSLCEVAFVLLSHPDLPELTALSFGESSFTPLSVSDYFRAHDSSSSPIDSTEQQKEDYSTQHAGSFCLESSCIGSSSLQICPACRLSSSPTGASCSSTLSGSFTSRSCMPSSPRTAASPPSPRWIWTIRTFAICHLGMAVVDSLRMSVSVPSRVKIEE